jgi:DNA-binding response OmpR family regulator
MYILLAEDEYKVAAFIQQGLEEQQHIVDIVPNGNTALEMARNNTYDLLILDAMLPGQNGFALCAAIRTFDKNVPILMLTALDALEDKERGFGAGADDYLTKPFEFKELLLRIQSLARRSMQIRTTELLTCADLVMNTEAKTVMRGNNPIQLTAKEFSLLEYMLRNQGKVMPKTKIARSVWGISFDTESNVIEVYFNFLRKKIDKDYNNKLLHTVIGMGYILKDENSAQ